MSTPTLSRTSGSGGPTTYWMGENGTEQCEIERDDLITDIEGEHLCTLIGVSDTFQYTSSQWGEKTGIRLLFEVATGARKGEQFSLMFGYSIGKKARMTPVIEALRRAPIGEGDEIALGALIGEHCYLFLKINETVKDGTTYQNVNCGDARAYKPQPKRQQPAKAAPARRAAPVEEIEEDDDPFDGDEVPY